MDPANNVLTPQTTFVAIALFNILRTPMLIMALVITQVVQFHVSNERLKTFLAAEELDAPPSTSEKSDTAGERYKSAQTPLPSNRRRQQS